MFNYIVRADLQYCQGKKCWRCEEALPDFHKIFGGVSLLHEEDLPMAHKAQELCPESCIIISRIRKNNNIMGEK